MGLPNTIKASPEELHLHVIEIVYSELEGIAVCPDCGGQHSNGVLYHNDTGEFSFMAFIAGPLTVFSVLHTIGGADPIPLYAYCESDAILLLELSLTKGRDLIKTWPHVGDLRLPKEKHQ